MKDTNTPIHARISLTVDYLIDLCRSALRGEEVGGNDLNTLSFEQRLLLSATPLVAAAELAVDQNEAELESINDEKLGFEENQTQDDSSSSQSAVQLILIDAGVEDFETLLYELELGEDSNLELAFLEADSDGIGQISAILERYEEVESVHIIAHGAAGQVHIGNSILSNENISQYESQLSSWSNHLGDSADVLIYGCDVAGNESGQQLLSQISELTGADVAGSTDLTGHRSLGGDWELEYVIGSIESHQYFSYETTADWQQTLRTIYVTNTTDDVNGDLTAGGSTTAIDDLLADDGGDGISLREAIIAANQTAGHDTIILTSETYELSETNTLDEEFFGDLDVSDDLTIIGTSPNATTIKGASGFRVFEVTGGVLTLENLAITGGQASGNQAGGGIFVANGATLSATRVSVHDNQAEDGGGIFVDNGGLLSLKFASIYSNDATDEGAGIYIGDSGPITIEDSEFYDNSAADKGGAIHIDNKAIVSITNSSFHDNNADKKGGAISAEKDSQVDVTGSTISANSSEKGGGLFVKGTLNLSASTVAYNQGTNANGAGIYEEGNGGLVTVYSSILADNLAKDGIENAHGDVVSLGFNIDSDGSAGIRPPFRLRW